MLSLKHILFITLAAAYLLASTGLVVNLHYCLGRVNAVSLAVQDEARCICPEPTAEKDCCRSEQQLLETQSTHLLTDQFVFQPQFTAHEALVWFEKTNCYCFNPTNNGVSRAPPEAIYKRNQVFRI